MVQNINVKKTPELCRKTQFHPSLKGFVGHFLYRSAMRYKRQLDHSLEPLGVISPCLAVLKIVDLSGPLSQNELGQYLEIDKASMVKFIDQLEQLKLLERTHDRKDRRVNHISLTTEGKAFLKAAIVKHKQVEAEFLQPLTKTESQQLKALLAKLLGQEI